MIYIWTKVSVTIFIYFCIVQEQRFCDMNKLNFQYVLWLSGLWCHVIQLAGTNTSDYSVFELSYVISFKEGMYFRFCVCSLPQMKGTPSCHQNPFWILHPCSLYMYTVSSVMYFNARHNAYHYNLGWDGHWFRSQQLWSELDNFLCFCYISGAGILSLWQIYPLIILHSFDMNTLHGIHMFIHNLLHQWLL